MVVRIVRIYHGKFRQFSKEISISWNNDQGFVILKTYKRQALKSLIYIVRTQSMLFLEFKLNTTWNTDIGYKYFQYKNNNQTTNLLHVIKRYFHEYISPESSNYSFGQFRYILVV